MDQETFLASEDHDRLVWIAESAIKVKNSAGFFLWTQGAVQLLIPHEILLCGVKPNGGNSLQMQRFSSSRYFRDEHFKAVCDPNSGLVPALVARWLRTGAPAFMLPGEDEETDELLTRTELKSVVSHGVWGADADVSGYFCFSRTPLKADHRTVRVLEVVVPIIYVTFLRVLAADLGGEESKVRMNNVVTKRELEILGWIKEGKTTHDIALILGLSPFTVKNHVQNVLKKLGARSRSHAVAQALNMGLLQHRGH